MPTPALPKSSTRPPQTDQSLAQPIPVSPKPNWTPVIELQAISRDRSCQAPEVSCPSPSPENTKEPGDASKALEDPTPQKQDPNWKRHEAQWIELLRTLNDPKLTAEHLRDAIASERADPDQISLLQELEAEQIAAEARKAEADAESPLAAAAAPATAAPPQAQPIPVPPQPNSGVELQAIARPVTASPEVNTPSVERKAPDQEIDQESEESSSDIGLPPLPEGWIERKDDYWNSKEGVSTPIRPEQKTSALEQWRKAANYANAKPTRRLTQHPEPELESINHLTGIGLFSSVLLAGGYLVFRCLRARRPKGPILPMYDTDVIL